MKERQVDIVIIGSGSAGLNAMAQVREAGRSFVLINGGSAGTTCARIGCMPSKVMIHIAEKYYRRTHFGQYGIDGQRWRAKAVVIATGSTPIMPAPWRQFGKRVINTDEGKIAGYNAAHVGQAPLRFHRRPAFYVNFCDPNIVAVGDRFELIDQGRSQVAEVSFATVGRARAMGEARACCGSMPTAPAAGCSAAR